MWRNVVASSVEVRTLPLSSRAFEPLPNPQGIAWLLRRLMYRVATRSAAADSASSSRALGRLGEDVACWCLRRRGYTIVARNFRSPGLKGELDIVALEGEPPCMVFVEVKTRTVRGQFAADDAVDRAQRAALMRLASSFRRRRRHHGPSRFDMVAIEALLTDHPSIRLHRHAFPTGKEF